MHFEQLLGSKKSKLSLLVSLVSLVLYTRVHTRVTARTGKVKKTRIMMEEVTDKRKLYRDVMHNAKHIILRKTIPSAAARRGYSAPHTSETLEVGRSRLLLRYRPTRPLTFQPIILSQVGLSRSGGPKCALRVGRNHGGPSLVVLRVVEGQSNARVSGEGGREGGRGREAPEGSSRGETGRKEGRTDGRATLWDVKYVS